MTMEPPAKRICYAKGMMLAEHPELFEDWELDPTSDSQILLYLPPVSETENGHSEANNEELRSQSHAAVDANSEKDREPESN